MGSCHLTVGLFWAAVLVSQTVYCLSEKKTVTLCEFDVTSIECSNGTKIVIADAMFGRADRETCLKGPVQDDNCSSMITLPVLSKKCDDTTKCTLNATNYWFSDPCIGTFKYLTVNYFCTDNITDVINSKVICESETDLVDCPEGTTFHVKSATYGRVDNTTCPHKDMRNTKCSAPKAYFILYERCELKETCDLEASNLVFGDPCKGTHKYLTVDYTCS